MLALASYTRALPGCQLIQEHVLKNLDFLSLPITKGLLLTMGQLTHNLMDSERGQKQFASLSMGYINNKSLIRLKRQLGPQQEPVFNNGMHNFLDMPSMVTQEIGQETTHCSTSTYPTTRGVSYYGAIMSPLTTLERIPYSNIKLYCWK